MMDATSWTVTNPGGEFFRVMNGPRKVADFGSEANATLAAAAPDLLAACEAMLASTDYCDDDRPLMNTIRAVRAAVAKAKGAP